MTALDAAVAFNPATVRTLLINADDLMRGADKRMLEGAGFTQVIDVTDGTAEQISASIGEWDLLVVEWSNGGLDLLKALRANPATACLPVVAISSNTDPRQAVDAKMAKISGFLFRPISGPSVTNLIGKAIARATA